MTGCGKIPYPSAAKARSAMASTLSRARKRKEGKPEAYYCAECAAHHWGNSFSKRPPHKRHVALEYPKGKNT